MSEKIKVGAVSPIKKDDASSIAKFKLNVDDKHLLSLPQWIMWKLVHKKKGQKPTKVPYQINGHMADTTNPKTWSRYEELPMDDKRFSGIGLIITEGLVFVDFDHVLDKETGEFLPDAKWAEELIEQLKPSYLEISPSGDGLHTFLKGTLPAGHRNKIKMGNGTELEVYTKERFSTVTANPFRGSELIVNALSEDGAKALTDIAGTQNTVHTVNVDVTPHSTITDEQEAEVISEIEIIDTEDNSSREFAFTHAYIAGCRRFDIDFVPSVKQLREAMINRKLNEVRTKDHNKLVAGSKRAQTYLQRTIKSALTDAITFDAVKAEGGESLSHPKKIKKLLAMVNPLFMDANKVAMLIGNMVYEASKGKFWVLEENQLKMAGKGELKIFIDALFKDEVFDLESNTEFRAGLVEYYLDNVDGKVVEKVNASGQKYLAVGDVTDPDLWTWMQESQKILIEEIKKYLIRHRQIKTFKVLVDPFAKRDSMKVIGDTAEVTYHKLFPKTPKKCKNDAILAEYKSHFKELDNLLDLIIAVRFGASRKEAYLWMKLMSNWGKSFLFQAVLQPLGITTTLKEKEIKKAFAGDPVGMMAEEFTHSFVLVFEEFKGAVSELKDITHQLTFASKGAPRTTVELYLKMFLSADGVESLQSSLGVEDQFANRFMKWENLSGDLSKLPVMSSVSDEEYADIIRSYVYDYLKAKADEMIAMGKQKAAKASIEVMHEFRKKYAFKAKSLNEGVQEVATGYLERVKRVYMGETSLMPDNEVRFINEHFTMDGDELYMYNPAMVKEHFIKTSIATSEQTKVKHKSLKEIFDLDERRTKKTFAGGQRNNCHLVGLLSL